MPSGLCPSVRVPRSLRPKEAMQSTFRTPMLSLLSSKKRRSVQCQQEVERQLARDKPPARNKSRENSTCLRCFTCETFKKGQTQTSKENVMASKRINGKERPNNMIDPDDALILLIDHQSGLFQTVKDMEMTVLRANVVTLAKVATLAKIPVITTASVPQGPNGPLIPEIHKYAPHAKYVARRGQINAWDNPEFVTAVKATGKKQ